MDTDAPRPTDVGAVALSLVVGVVAGVAYLQVALVALTLGLVTNPFLAVATGVVAILATTYAERVGVAGGV